MRKFFKIIIHSSAPITGFSVFPDFIGSEQPFISCCSMPSNYTATAGNAQYAFKVCPASFEAAASKKVQSEKSI
jgi:hypothetical protein